MHPMKKWLTLAIVSSALFLIVVDMTVLYTALPALTRDLQAIFLAKTVDHQRVRAGRLRSAARPRHPR